MTAQGRAASRTVLVNGRRGLGVALILAALALSACAGHQPGSPSFRFSSETPLQVVRVTDFDTIRASGGALTDLGGFRPVSMVNRPTGMFLSDLDSGRLLRLAQNGTVDAIAGSQSPNTTGARRPARFIRADITGNIYATDGMNDRATIYDPQLRVVATLVPPYLALELSNGQITGIATGAYGEVYLADRLNAVVYRYDASGAYISKFSGEGVPWAQLRQPMGMACDNRDGSVYVCDPAERRITVFDNTGTPTRSFGEVDLREPEAVAVDRLGQVYVADPVGGAVVVFSRDGHFLGRIDGPRLGLQSIAPSDVVVDDSLLLIADPRQGRIIHVLLGGETEATPSS